MYSRKKATSGVVNRSESDLDAEYFMQGKVGDAPNSEDNDV
ncbi:hypothetical protein SAMN05216266_12033 [Amycolatopsis marina]|uniref:Uncharacterized protein n=1 Tax=Amycolatopsis marina TaxID=490629 RepID=A0A1I1C3P5_9PSEU|nr:hypothetical protein [Amycolatopsis marina]SFB56676.1 hypothetical protein SAMN05216266_12033 [Amycolatopsis marina]